MNYSVDFTEDAKNDIVRLKRSEPKAYKKMLAFLVELQVHPMTGTGHPKPLSADRSRQWSRRITDKHRLIYEIEEERVTVLVLSAYGHYNDR